MPQPWLPNIPSWNRPSRLRGDGQGSRPDDKTPVINPSRQPVSRPPHSTMDRLGQSGQRGFPQDHHHGLGSSLSVTATRLGTELTSSWDQDTQQYFPRRSQPSSLDRTLAYGIQHTTNPGRPSDHAPRHTSDPAITRGEEYIERYRPRPIGDHPRHPALTQLSTARRNFEEATPSNAYSSTSAHSRPSSAHLIHDNPEHQLSQPHVFNQQPIPAPFFTKALGRTDPFMGVNTHEFSLPQPISSGSPTSRLNTRPKQPSEQEGISTRSVSTGSRFTNQKNHFSPRFPQIPSRTVQADRHQAYSVSRRSSVGEQTIYPTPRPTHPDEPLEHGTSNIANANPGDRRTAPSPRQQGDGLGTPIVNGIRLISLRQALPDRFRAIFPYDLFNAVQSKCFPIVYGGTDNVVVSAPTGSGKTTILELAICKLALDRGNENFKIVYQAPTKALCYEKARDWEKKFSHMSLKCAELTGDTSQAEMRRVGDASIIVTTPEKWDSITRKWQDHRRLLQMVELFLIDEVHILKDARGATLEAVVSRMKTIGANVRFVALSATVPNSDDIAQWLGRNHTNQHLPAHRETFAEEFRPVKLQKFVHGYEYSGNEFMFDKFLDQKIPGLISRHSQRKPILIFCFTRKSCETTAAQLADYVSDRPTEEKLWPIPSRRVGVISRELQEITKFGVAFHHAGVEQQDRLAVEQAFLQGDLGVICCTSTLAVGVNLPCHTVFLKGTVGFSDDKVQEYSDLEVMQMLGRAGRPQFDDSATAVILTRKENKSRYEKMVSGQEILESTLHLNLIEHLNSEICLGTITNLQSARTWLSGTFLSVRLRRNPNYYRLTDSTSNPNQIDDKLAQICERDIKELQSVDLVTESEPFKSTNYGLAMSKYLVEFATMKMLLQIPRAAKMESLITIISQSMEFKDFRLKPNEKNFFREVNQSSLIVYPIKEPVSQNWHKISLMIQAHLGCIQYPDFPEAAKIKKQLMSERKAVFEKLSRLTRAVIDCKEHDRDSVGMKNALELARALAAESWEGRATQLTQIPNIGPVGMRKLASKGIRTVLELANREPQDIERFLSRQPPFGNTILSSLDKFPRLDFDLVVVGHKVQRAREPAVNIEIQATLRYLNRKGTPSWKSRVPPLTFLAESSDGALGFFWRGNIRKLDSQDGLKLKFTVALRDVSNSIACHFSCEEIVGTSVSKAVHHNIPASAFPKQPKVTAARATPKRSTVPEFMDDDGIDDTELLGLAHQTETAHSTSTFTTEPLTEPEFDDFPSIEDLLEIEESGMQMKSHHRPAREPVQLPNGKWQCNHVCSGGTLTKAGKSCNHRCCKEGLDKPRKHTPRAKRKATDVSEDDEQEHPHDHKGSQQSQSTLNATQHSPQPISKPPKRKKVADPHQPAKMKTCSPLKPSNKIPQVLATKPIGITDVKMECIDLSFSDEEDQTQRVDDSVADIPFHPTIASPASDNDDCIMLDNSSSPFGHARASTYSRHFRAGAKDEMLYEGISRKFEQAAKRAGQSSDAENVDDFDDGATLSVSNSLMIDDQSTAKCSAAGVSTDEGERIKSNTVALKDCTEAASWKREDDPKWLSEMKLDAESMELVESLRGYVTFI